MLSCKMGIDRDVYIGREKTKMSNETFSNRLVVLRKEQNVNKSGMAKLLGLSRSMITMYEAGTRVPSIDVLIKISDFFDVSIDWILCRSDSRQLIKNKNLIPVGRTVRIPVLKQRVQETNPVDSVENVEEYVEVPVDSVRSGEFFYVREGEGCSYLVKKQGYIDGDGLYAVLDGNSVVLQQVNTHGGLVILSGDSGGNGDCRQ